MCQPEHGHPEHGHPGQRHDVARPSSLAAHGEFDGLQDRE